MPNLEELASIGIVSLVALLFFAVVGMKGLGGLAICILVMTLFAGFMSSKG